MERSRGYQITSPSPSVTQVVLVGVEVNHQGVHIPHIPSVSFNQLARCVKIPVGCFLTAVESDSNLIVFFFLSLMFRSDCSDWAAQPGWRRRPAGVVWDSSSCFNIAQFEKDLHYLHTLMRPVSSTSCPETAVCSLSSHPCTSSGAL